jgi:FkbM family methyltransferase
MDKIIEYAGKEVTFCDLNPKDALEGGENIYQGRWYELPTLEFIQSLEVQGNYADVGANIGTHSLFFSLFCPANYVYSFEPHRFAYLKLLKNLAANEIKNCTPYNMALSNEITDGHMFQVTDQAAQAHLSKVTDGPWHDSWPGPSRINDVKVVTLDSLNLDISLLKIDVEGHEFEVLKGAKETLKSVEHLIVEIWSHGLGCNVRPFVKDQSQESLNFIQEQGFKFKQMTPGDTGNWYFHKEK